MSDAPKDSSPQEVDASFNDDELQDIMNEIESLEQEFGEAEETVALEDADHEDIERELQELEASIEEEMEEPSEPAQASVHPISSHSPAPASSPCVELQASGSMNMSFNVPVGEHQACVSWNGEVLSVTLNGVCIELNSDSCQVELPGGASFNVPVMPASKARAA